MSIVLDKPEQIAMWVLLSRRHQVQLQMNGLKTPGLVKWVRENIEGAESVRTARQCVIPLEFAISQAGGEVDYKLVNLHIMAKINNTTFQDLGIFDSPESIHPESRLAKMNAAGQAEIVLTLEPVRPANGNLFTTV